jgi:hypothetical protein
MQLRLAIGVALGACSTPRTFTPDLARIADATRWHVENGETRALVEDGRSVLHLAPIGGDRHGSNVALALVTGLAFDEGTIEVDLKGRGRERTFLGVAFDVVDTTRFEAVYFRPFNFRPEDASHRTHAVQYVSWPAHTWETLRENTPSIYEHPIEPIPDPAGWFHARIDVSATEVKVYVDHASLPSLVVTRLEPRASGGVGLFVDSREGTFGDFRIAPR